MQHKCKLLGRALMMSLLAVPAMGMAQPHYYGKLSVGLANREDTASNDRLWELTNRASRLGLEGEVALQPNVTLLYQYEVGIDPTTDAGDVLSLRNSYLGLAGTYGQLIAGTFDTPFKEAQGDIDRFNDTLFDMSNLLAGEVRHDQSLQYTSPSAGGLQLTLDWMPSQVPQQEDGIAAMLGYAAGQLQLNVAVSHEVSGDGGIVTDDADHLDAVRLAMQWQATDALNLGLLVQQTEATGNNETREQTWLASVAYEAGRWAYKAQLGQGVADKNAAGQSIDAQRSQLALGVDYDVGKAVTAYSYVGMYRDEDGAGSTVVGEENTYAGVGVGLTYAF